MALVPEISVRIGGRGSACVCMGGRNLKSEKSNIKSLTCRGGWTPLKLSRNYESFSIVIETGLHIAQYLVKEDNRCSNFNN